MKGSKRTRRVVVTADGQGVVSHAGIGLLREMAEYAGLVEGVSAASLDTYKGLPVHPPGRVFTDLAVAVADGADAISGIAVLADRTEVFGPVASMPTTWRVLDRIDAEHLERVRRARAQARQRAWAAGAGPDLSVELRLDFDATITIAHSEKENAPRPGDTTVHSEIAAVPAERLPTEREVLTPLPSLQLRIGPPPVLRTVDRLSCVRVGSARYSVPTALIGTKLAVEVTGARVLIADPATGVVHAEHALVAPGEASVHDEHHGGPTRPTTGSATENRCRETVLRARASRRGVHRRCRGGRAHPPGPELAELNTLAAAHGTRRSSARSSEQPRSGGRKPTTCARSWPSGPAPRIPAPPATPWSSTCPAAPGGPWPTYTPTAEASTVVSS